MGPKDVHCRPM